MSVSVVCSDCTVSPQRSRACSCRRVSTAKRLGACVTAPFTLLPVSPSCKKCTLDNVHNLVTSTVSNLSSTPRFLCLTIDTHPFPSSVMITQNCRFCMTCMSFNFKNHVHTCFILRIRIRKLGRESLKQLIASTKTQSQHRASRHRQRSFESVSSSTSHSGRAFCTDFTALLSLPMCSSFALTEM